MCQSSTQRAMVVKIYSLTTSRPKKCLPKQCRKSRTCYILPLLKTQEMCDEKAVREDPYRLQYFPDPLTTREMCIKVVAENPWNKQCPSLVCQAKASKSVAA